MFKKIHKFIDNYWNTKTQIVIILLVSLITRFWFLSNHVVFSNDSIRDYLIIKNNINDGDYIVELGPKASVGNFYLPPFYYQLHLFLTLIFPEQPLVMNYFITLVESFTPVIVFLILIMFVKKEYAILSSFLYAVSPLPVYFGTLAWNPVMIPFFSSFSLYFLLQAYFNKKPHLITFSIVFASLANQLHYQSVVLIPFFILCFLYSIVKQRSHLKYFLIGTLISLCLMMPYFYSEYKNEYINTSNIINYFNNDHSGYYDRVRKIDYVLTFIPTFAQKTITGETDENILFGRLIILLPITLLFYDLYHKNYKRSFLICYFFMIMVSLRLYKGDKIDYYMSALFVMPSIFLGLFSSVTKKLFYPLVFIMIVISANKLKNTPNFNDYNSLLASFTHMKQNLKQKNLRFYFHDISKANNLAYFFYLNPDYTLDQESNILIEIYDKNMQKSYDCNDLSLKEINKLKCDANYNQTSEHLDPKGFIITIGELINKEKIKKVIYHEQPNKKIGHDIFLKNIYEDN